MKTVISSDKLTITQIIAVVIYFVFGVMIWFPLALLFATVNAKLTVLLFSMYFVISICKLYLGIK